MRIWNGIEEYPGGRAPVVATIGNYDGVHLGHRQIVDSVTAEAARRGLQSLLVTFDPHPLEVVAPDRRPRLLMTRRQKLDRLEELGLDGVLVLRFDRALAALEASAFFTSFLADRVSLASLHVGGNFRFGRGREGNLAVLQQVGAERGFEIVPVPPVTLDGEAVSSTATRTALAAGDVERAWRFLGAPYELTGRVVRGDGRGRSVGFPTANLDIDNELIPGAGVYVTEAAGVVGTFSSVTNVGTRPTFGGESLVAETHLLDFEGNLYDERLAVRFLARLRDERRFEGTEDLADQISRDLAAAVSYFNGRRMRIS